MSKRDRREPSLLEWAGFAIIMLMVVLPLFFAPVMRHAPKSICINVNTGEQVSCP